MAGENIVALTETNFEQEVVGSPLPVVVNFWADWCRPCTEMGPVFGALAQEFDGRVKAASVNIDEQPSLAARHEVRAFPALLVFRNGQVANRFVGSGCAPDLRACLESISG